MVARQRRRPGDLVRHHQVSAARGTAFRRPGTTSWPTCRSRCRRCCIPGTGKPIGAGRPGAALPDGADRAGSLHRARDRDPRTGARDLPPVAADAAVPRAPPGAGARYPGAHLLQVRRRSAPPGQPQAQHRRAAGLLQQGGRRQAAGHRDRRRPVGLVARLRLRLLRPRVQGLHGEGELRPEALPPRADGDLRRRRRRQPEQRDRRRPRDPGQVAGLDRAASASPSRRRSRSRPRMPTPSTRSAACSTTCCCTRR